MRRFAASIVACSAFVIGFSAGNAFGEDYYCPPDAKFCPAPGLSQASAATDASFGLGEADTYGTSQLAVHTSQLHEGEKLIMVAPSTGVGMAMLPMDDGASPMFASAAVPQAMDGYQSTAYAPASTGGYQTSTYAPAPMYASGPVSGGADMDFIPPPPGTPRPSPNTYGGDVGRAAQPVQQNYQAAPVYAAPPPFSPGEPSYQAPRASREAQAPRVASAASRPAREPVKVSGPAARVAPTDSPLAPSPSSFSRSHASSGRDAYDSDAPAARRPAESRLAEKPAKKKRADMLSEVANETSRKGDKKTEKSASKSDSKTKKDKKEKRDKKEKASSDDKVPWWKGGMWRNRNK